MMYDPTLDKITFSLFLIQVSCQSASICMSYEVLFDKDRHISNEIFIRNLPFFSIIELEIFTRQYLFFCTEVCCGKFKILSCNKLRIHMAINLDNIEPIVSQVKR